MLTLSSPAKINLFLRILGKRPDQYHELASLFQTINFYDRLTFSIAAEDLFTVSGCSLPLDGRNLVIQALKLFRNKTHILEPVAIHLEKNIFQEAGLGGGSSNAATTLFGLNQLFQAGYSDCELSNWSSAIGSDVPFFFSSGIAFCKGRGEKVESLKPLVFQEYSIIKPAMGLSTSAVYQALDLKSVSSVDPERLLADFYSGKPQYINDLELPAFKIRPELKAFKELLPFNYAAMTGSGSAFFGVGPKKAFLSLRKALPVHRLSGKWYS